MPRLINPATGDLVREVPDAMPEDIARALMLATAAQPAWARLPLADRLSRIAVFRGLVAAAVEPLACTLTIDMGKPITQARAEVVAVLDRIDFFLARAATVLAPRELLRDEAGGLVERLSHEPIGVIANISAWNYPWFVGANVFIPALIAGNAVLYKPSEHATQTGLAIAAMMHQAGVPREIFVALPGSAETGANLIAQPVDGVFFTGSWRTGQAIATTVGPSMARLQLELGGKDPVYVAEDVDVAVAAASTADGAFYNAGQSCCSVERIYVHHSVHDAFVASFVATVRGFVVGEPDDDRTYIGPIAREAHLGHLAAQVADARRKGATMLCGGGRIDRPGWWFQPTVFTGVDHSMELMREETFGPLIGIQSVRDDTEARALMADTAYGLTAGVYCRDAQRAEAILGGLDVGTAYWNCCDRVSPRLPWSGRRHSGVGCTLSDAGILAFAQPKAWHLRRG
ncbi:MAG TPA: aldehyde dehydrogenase family protein [Planctomycetota bacterium]|nr:aldehyde dehydrogenase family protein [Planctomycetota bacterium]